MSDLANAPLIDTDIPTSDAYYYKALPFATSTTSADSGRRYLTQDAGCSIVSMDNVPNTFSRDSAQKGIVALVRTANFDGSNSLRLVVHQPTGSVRDYITGWDQLPEVTSTIGSGNANVQFTQGGCVASQRQGQYAYAFLQMMRFGIFSDTLAVTVYKVTRDEYVEVVGVAGGGQSQGGTSTFAQENIIGCLNSGQFFVSDEEQPFIWNVTGTCSFGGRAMTTGFRDDNSGSIGYSLQIGNDQPRVYHGQSAAYMQYLQFPAGVHGYGPVLVHPWSSGSYNPPELWFLVTEMDSSTRTTGRFHIQRSRWKKGAYRKPDGVVLGEDDAFNNGQSPFPALNPLGYGWEQDCFDESHRVGTIGPFSSMPVWNPRGDPMAALQNSEANTGAPLGAPGTGGFTYDPQSTLPLGFKVVRDKKRMGVLHLVIGDGGSYPRSGAEINRLWFANSSDDGSTWSRMNQIGPAVIPSTQGSPGVSEIAKVTRTDIPTQQGLFAHESLVWANQNSDPQPMLSLVRTHDDVLLLGNFARFTSYSYADGSSALLSQQPPDAGAKIAMVVVDYTGAGAGLALKENVVFVQQANRGSISWQ